MGRLSPIINYSMLVLTIIVITFLMPNHAAPVQDTAASRYANEKGCYFMNKHYQTGHVIETNDPCMNCTCTNAAMMCYLRVCPFIKPLGENCHMEKHVGDCCPKYWCPEVYPRVTAPRPDKDEKGCYLNGLYYEEGSRLPVDPLNPCHACYCIRNVSVCTNETCELHIPGCYPRYKIGSCCPASYECTEDAATTVPPTMLEAETPAPGCNVDGILYEDGVEVPSNESCNKCYCMRHQVMCTAIECTAPGTNCVPQEVLEGQCCPEKYDCPEDTQISEFSTTHMISTEEEFLNLTTIAPPFTSTATSFSVPVAEDLASKDAFSTTESEQLFPTTKGIRRIDEGETVTVVPGLDVEETTTAGTIMTVTGPRIPKITEIPEDMFTTSKPRIATGRPFFPKRPIPGEGICRHEDRTYQNREKVESSDPCRENCTCVNSVVKCDVIECVLEPPTPGVKCKVKKLDNECCPKYICDIPSITTLSEETEIPDKDTAEETFTKDFLENITLPDIVTMQAETVTEEKVVSETTESSTEVFRQTTLEAEIIAKSGATTTEKEQSVFTEELLSMPDAKSTEEPRSTQESTDEIKDTITETAITAKEKHTEAEIVPEKDGISTTSVILEAETVTITTPTEKPFKVTITEQDVTDKPLDAQMTTISAVIKDSTEIVPTTSAEEKETQFIPEKLSTTTGVTKITSETESSITQLSTKEKDVTEALTTDLSTIGKDDEEIFTKVSKETTLEIKTTETLESVTSEITTKEEIIAATATPMKEDVSTTDKKFQAETVSTSHPLVDFTTKEGLSTIETKTTEIPEMSSTVFFSDEKELNITDEKTTPTSTLELKITSAFLPTDEKEQTVVTEGEFLKVSEAKSTVEPSTAQVSTDKIKETSTITPITTKVKDMESQVTSEKEGISTTVAILEAETVTISEKEKLTLAAEEIKTELEKEITDGMKRITTVLPTKDQDLETEVTPEKESIPKTAETTKIETITITPSAMEKEKSTHVTEEISELATKTTEEMKDITTVSPTKEKGPDSEIIAEISTTKATTEVESVTLIPRVTQKEIIIPTTEEIKTELETEVTHETKEVSTALPTKETESEASAEKDLISTTAITAEAETIAVTESVTERVETIPTTGEMKTELATKVTDEMKEITTPLITIEKGEETEVASEKERISTTTTMFEAETVTIIPRVPQREEITPTTDDIKTESETGTTEMKEISTVLPIKETELETKVTTEKESISTTSAVTATLTPSVMEKEKSTFTTEESKPELETETTHEMKEISIALPTTKKDVQPETAPEKQFISTTTAMLEAETVAITQKATEKEKLIPITEESKTKLTTKITDEMKDFTIILPIKEKDAETEAIAVEEGISTTATALETKTVTITTIVTETEKSTSISRESTTESEMAKTGEMTEITTALPTKEKDVETEVVPEKESISTTEASLDAETVTLTSSVSEKEKSTISSKESATEMETKITDETKEVTTALPIKVKDAQTEITPEKESISTTAAVPEEKIVTMTSRTTEKEISTPITEESISELETKITDEMKEIATAFPTKEKDLATKVTSEKEIILTVTEMLEGETVTMTPSVTEKVNLTFTTEESKPELQTKISEMEVTTLVTEMTPKEKDIETKITPEVQFLSTTTAILEAETVTTTPRVTEKEKLAPTSDESKTELEMKITDEMKEITTIFSTKQKDVETEITADRDGTWTTAAVLETKTVTEIPTVTEAEISTSISRESTTESEMKKTDEMMEIITAISTTEKDVETKVTSEKESILTTQASLEVESVTLTSSVSEKEMFTPIVEESKSELDVKITDEMKEITTVFPITEKDVESEITPEKETILTTTEILGETVTVLPTVSEKVKLTTVTEKSETDLETKITEVKEITTMLPVKEKDMETEVTIKEKDLETEVTPEMKLTSTTIAILEVETVTITQSVTEKEKLTPTSEESKSEIEMKITDEIKEITTISPIKEKDVETEVTPVEEYISTTESSLEVQTVTLTSSVTEKEKSIITTKESKTELETKITDKMGEITTVMPTKEKETETEIPIEKDHILTTTAVLEAKTVTMTSSVTEEEVSTPVIQESTTLEAQTTEKLMELTTAFPTKEKDLESEITPKKEMISTTTEIVEAQTVTMTPNITEKEKLTPTTEEAKFAFETKITEVKEITTLPIKEKDLETDITSEKVSDSTTKEILETKTVTMPTSMTEKEQFTTVSPEMPIEGIMGTSEMENVSIVDKEFQAETISQSEPTVDFTTKLEPTTFVIKTTEKSEMSSTVSLIDEKEMKITEKESATISTSEIKTDSTPEKEPSMITDEELLTDSETKSTEETHSTQVATDITKDSVTDLQSKMTTTTILHTQRVSTLSSVGEKEMTTVLMERDETTLEAKTTDKIKEVTTAISLEEKDLEINVTTQKESFSTTAATLESETVTMKERITGVEEFTRPTEVSKTDLAAEVTGKIKEISTTLPMEEKDTEITSKEQLISTTEAMLEAETVTLTPVTEREKVTFTTEESKTELKTKITAETEEITTILPIKEKDVEMDVLTDKEDISTTAILETRTVAVTPAATETEKSTSVLTGKTEEMTEIVTGLPTRETDVEPEVAHEKENISTTAVALDVETVTLTSSVLEKEKSTITTKESKTEIGTKITDEILSTTLPTKEEGIETEVTTTKDRISTTTATLEAMTITMKSSVTEKEMSTPVTEESKSELEMKTTDEKIKITTAFAAKEQEVESEIIPEKEIVSMTTEILEAETVTMTPSVTEKVKVTSAAEDSSSLPTDDSELKIKSFTKFDNISTLATTLVTEIVITEKEKITKTELGTDSIPHASATESAHTDKPLTESTYITEFTEAKSAEITSRPDTESVSSSAIPEFLESSSFEAESESTSQQFSDSDKISLHMTTEKDLSGVTEEVTLKSFSSVPTTSFVSFVENDTSVTTFIGTTEVKSETEMKETEKHTEKVTVVDISTLASSSVSTPISKDVESPITVKPDVSETMLDEITFKKTDVPLTTVHLEKISTIPPTLTDKIESIEIITSPIVPELISEKTDKIDNETTSTLLKFTTDSSTLPIEKVQSTTMSILKDLDRGLTSEETDQTIHETDIVTDNVFTSIKHVPDSLIREKTTIVTAKTEEITFSPIDVTQTTTSIADRDQFFDQDVVTMSTSRSSSEIDIEEKAQTMSLEGETSTGTLTAEKLKTTTLHDKDDTDLIKEEISTTSKAETDTSFKITDLDKGTELLKLSTPSLTVTPSSLPSAISTTVHAELEAETSSISLPKEEEIVSDVSIIDEENEILSRKSTVSETRDVDKFTAIELTKVTESEIVSKTTMTEPFVSTTEKVPELIAIQEAETSTLQPADKTLSTTELLTTEKFTTGPPVKETEFSFVTTATSKEPEVTVKIKLSAETDIPEAISTAKEPHITKFTSLDEIQTSANMTEAPTKEREITTSILSKLSTTTSSIIIEDKTTFSTALPIGDEKKDDFVTLSTSEIDITSTSHKTSFKFDSELSTDVGTTEISKDITKKPLTTETQREETVTVSSLEDKISTDKSETTEKDHITTLSSTEIPSIQTETSFLTSLKTDEIIDTMTSPTMLPKEITDKTSPIDMKSSTPEEEKEAETQQTEKFESTKALFTFTSKFVETSHMNDTTSISDKQTGTTESMTEVQTTAFESKQTEFAKGLSVTSTEVPQTTEKDSTTIKLQTHTALDFTAETVSEATSDITKESTMVSQVETKQTSAKDLPTSTSKMHATDMTTDKFDLSTETSIQFLETTHTVTPIETFKAEEIETTSEHPPSTPEKIKTTLEITGFTSVDEKHIAVTQNTSTQIETSTKFFDSETKVEAELKAETTLFVSKEEPSTLTSKDFTTAFPEKEQTTKLSTFDAETTFTEHSVITEETISSNATFAADAMIKSQTSTIDITTSSLKTDISVTEEGVSSVDLKPKTATDVTTFETEGKDIIETTTKKPATESSTEVEVDKEFTSEREFKSSTFSSIAAQDLELRTTVTDKSGIVTTTREFKDDTVFSEDKISPTDKSIKEITETKSETPMSSEKVTTDIITSDLTKVSLTTLKELEDKTESLFVTEFVGKTSEPIETQEAETATQQPEITATAFVEEDKTTLVDVTLIPMELTTEKAVSISKETDVSTTKLDISTLMEKSTDAPFIQTISTVNETTMEPFEISGRRDEKIDAITPEKETQLPTKIPDMIPTTSKDIKISLKLETDKTEFDDVSTAFMPTKIPTMTEETLLITDTEASEIYSSTTDEGTTILTFTKTQKPVDSATEITIKTETLQTAETTKPSDIITDKTTTLRDKTIFTETAKPTDVTEESLKPETTFKDDFVTKEIVSEIPKTFIEKEAEVPSEIDKSISEHSATSSAFSTTVSAPIVFETAETTETDITSSTVTEILHSETSTSLLTEKSPEVSESTSSTATTTLPKIVTEETTTLRSVMITDLGRKASISEAETETTPTVTKEDVTPETFEDVSLTETTEDECIVNGTAYRDGEAIITIDPCEKCHCSLGEINCFKILCKLPKENCIPKFSSTLECCPSSYECPEEDKEKASTQTSFAASEMDLTTPIPISFMFSTTPKAIASTIFVTKSEVEERKKDAATTLSTDHLPTTAKIEASTESGISVTTITTEKAVPDTVDLTGRKSTAEAKTEPPKDLFKHVGTTVKDFDLRATETTEIFSKETDLISTTEASKEVSEIDESTTLSMEGEESSETTPEKSVTSVTFKTSTVRKETDITEVTKQPTETPTTFDTIRTTFADVHKEKEDKVHALFESTTISPSTLGEEMTKLVDFTTVLSNISTAKPTEPETPSSPVSEHGLITTEKPLKGITTEKVEEGTKEVTTRFDETTTSKIFDVTEKEEPMFGETATAESSDESVTASAKISEVTSFTEDRETSTFTYMPSKLPKLDDMFTSTEMTVSETARSKEVTDDMVETAKAETMQTGVPTITEAVTKDVLKDSNVTTTVHDEVPTEIKTSTKSIVTEKESSVTFKPITEETSIKTDLEVDELSTTSESLKEISTIQHGETTDYEIVTKVFETRKTIDSLDQKGTVSLESETEFSTTSTFSPTSTEKSPDEISARTMKPKDIQLGLSSGLSTDKDGRPIVSVADEKPSPHTTETVTSLDKNETLFTHPKETEFPDVSTIFTPISNVTTEFREQSEETETSATVTDRIFTFVSTRFTDIMKGITEFTTAKEESKITDITQKESTTVSSFDMTTEKTEKVTPSTLLSHRIDLDLDQSTTKEEITQEAETIKSASEEPLTISEEKLTTHKFDIGITTDKLTVTPSDVSEVSSTVTPFSKSEVTTKFIAETAKEADSAVTEMIKEKIQTHRPDENVTSTEATSTDIVKESSVSSEFTTSSEGKDTVFFTEKMPADITSMTTILSKTLPEEIVTRPSLFQNDTSSVQITEEITSESTKIEELTSFKTKEQTISSLSTEELAAETLKMEKETEEPSIIPHTKRTTIAFTTESEKEASFEETEVPSRATRKDVELEVTPPSFTKTDEDSEMRPGSTSTIDEKVTLRELSTSSESRLSVTSTSEHSTIHTETTVKSLEIGPTTHGVVTEKADSETLSIFNETVSISSEVTEEKITTTPLSQIVSETKTTDKEVSLTETKTEAFTPGIDIVTELPVIKTTLKEAIPSVAEDAETVKTETELPKVTESIDTVTHTTIEKSLATEEITTTQKAQLNLTEPISVATTLFPKLKTTVTASPMDTDGTTAKPMMTTVVEDAETTVVSLRKAPQTEATERPEISTFSTKEELNATEFVTKGYKAIETTTMKEEEDYIIDENTCIFEGRIFQSAEQIPRADPCEFCFCFRGDIICLQQSCPPPAPDCHQTTIPGYCCPRYECPVYVTSKNISALARRKGVTPIIIQRRIDKREISRPTMEVKGCQYNGTFYELGKTVTSASGPCLHCVCQEDGFMHCDPQRCKPEAPLMLKMNSNFFRRR